MRSGLKWCVLLVCATSALISAGCQSPTDPDDVLEVDDFLEVAVTPSTAVASEATDGRTYRVVRGNNQPDEILPYDWRTQFTIVATLNGRADDDDTLEFPVSLSGVTIAVKQASGGIVTAPTGGDTERYEFVSSASGNTYPGVNSSVTIGFDVWYDLPSLKREALVAVSLTFVDNDGQSFSKTVNVQVAP